MVSHMATFTIYWSGLAAAYVIGVGLSKLAAREACDRDWGLSKVLIDTSTAHQNRNYITNG